MSQNDIRQSRQRARASIAAGDLAEALRFLAQALANDPNDHESLAILDAVAEYAKSPLDLVADLNPSDFPRIAVRAHLLQRDGQFAAAVLQLLAVIQLRPDISYATWLARWYATGEVLRNIGARDVRSIASGIAEVLRQHPRVPAASEHRLTFECLLELVDSLRELSSARTKLALLSSSLLRRIDEHARAQRVAEETYATEPTAGAAMLVALASRQRGQFATAIDWLDRALELEPGDTGYMLELADCHLDDGNFAAAASCYETVLAKRPEHPWAQPAHLFALWLNGDGSQKESLRELAERSEAAANILRRTEYAPYETSLPLPKDPIASAIFDVLEQFTSPEFIASAGSTAGELKIQVEFPEAPSAVLALQLALADLGQHPVISLTCEQVPTPDPKSGKADEAISLWRFEDALGIPNVSPPSEHALLTVGNIARHPFRSEAWRAQIAERFARPQDCPSIADLLAVMVHPPAAPTARGALVWVQHVQFAAAFCLLHQNAIDELIALALGPSDWCTAAAAVALATAAREDEKLRPRIQTVFQELDAHIPEQGFCCYAYALAICWPWFDARMTRELWRRRRRLELAQG